MDELVCGYCGKLTDEPINRFGVHDYCFCELEGEDEREGLT